MTVTTIESREPIIAAMQDPAFYDHNVKEVTVLQTHISWVFLTGEYAYKVKKPMDFGFLDFTTLERRKHFCEEEIRLNGRLTDLYLEAVAITGTPEQPVLNGSGDAIEYAVKMRQFNQDQLIDKLLKQDQLTNDHIDEMADQIAAFHQQIAVSDETNPIGSAESVNAPVIQNFDQLDPLIEDAESRAQLSRLRSWSEQEYQRIENILEQRKQHGYIRECHGDMHLGNMALIDNHIAIFDGIEFNDEFRWIDVYSEIGFLYMDLYDRGAKAYAHRLLNRYLERSGDYAGLQVLRFYLVYRAMVRAKIASFRLMQPDLSDTEKAEVLQQYHSYTSLAESFTIPHKPAIYITHGVSGSGKTTISQQMLETMNLIRVRSDIERKRLFNLEAEADSESALDSGIYDTEATAKTYQRLAELAETITCAGHSVIVDATFLQKQDRELFKSLADKQQLDFYIVVADTDPSELEARLRQRQQQGDDASEANIDVLRKQLASRMPIEGDESRYIYNN